MNIWGDSIDLKQKIATLTINFYEVIPMKMEDYFDMLQKMAAQEKSVRDNERQKKKDDSLSNTDDSSFK